MIDQYVRQLKSADAEQRKKAVVALGKSGDRDALKILANVYKTDSDPAVRELALKAGRYLKKETEASEAPVRLGREEDEISQPLYYDEPAGAKVSVADVERAKGMVEQALEAHVRGQDERAADLLGRALLINENLRKDHYTTSLAATITGLDADEAVPMLVQKAPSGSGKAKQKDKRGTPTSGDREIGWGDAIIDLTLYGLVIAGGLVAIVLLAVEGIQVLLNSALLAGASRNTAEVSRLVADLQQAKLSLILGSIGVGVASAIVMLIYSFAIHFAAVSFMGGDGSVTELIHRMVPSQIGFMVLSIVAFLVYLFLLGSAAGANADEVVNSYSSAGSGLFLLLNVGFALWIARLIGNTYEFDIGRGCITQIIANVILYVGSFCCSCSLSFMLGSAVSNSVGRF